MPGQDAPLDVQSTATTRLRRATCAAAGLLLTGALVAGCGGGSPNGGVASLGSHTSASHSSTSGAAGASTGHEASPASQAIAYTACMHAHGVPNFPEPQVSEHGGSTSIKMAVPAGVGKDPKFKAASEACRKLLPGGGPGNQAPLTPAQQEQYLRAAACIRSHGVPNFPDPTFSGGGVHIEHQKLNESSPAFKAAVHDCESLIPGGVHGDSGHTQQAAPAALRRGGSLSFLSGSPVSIGVCVCWSLTTTPPFARRSSSCWTSTGSGWRRAADGGEAIRTLAVDRPDAVILDVLMPGLDGLEVCRRMRAIGDRTPVLMLTARAEVVRAGRGARGRRRRLPGQAVRQRGADRQTARAAAPHGLGGQRGDPALRGPGARSARARGAPRRASARADAHRVPAAGTAHAPSSSGAFAHEDLRVRVGLRLRAGLELAGGVRRLSAPQDRGRRRAAPGAHGARRRLRA